ncbi:MAG: ubiquitin [Crenarchaeota archaeon]|nr:ubiquitin [Thermoproteota archaeon]
MCAFNPRKLRKMLKNLDISNLKLEEVPNVVKVEIVFRDGTRLVIDTPAVAKMNIGGLVVFQIQAQASTIRREEKPQSAPTSGQEMLIAREEKKPYTDEDVELVVQETGCTREEAMRVLEETKGDIAEAIMLLKERRSGSGS